MTSTATTPPVPFARVSSHVDARSELKVWLGTCAVIAALFLALQNVYWIPGGDSEVYVASAKNLATGHGYLFNGSPARIAPPGWPLLLAAMMKYVSPTFLALKLVTMLSMLAGLSVYFFVLRRFVAPLTASFLVIGTALISHVYSLTFWLHSDALFTLITAATLLLSLQINEGKRLGWRVALLLILCAASTAVRWAAVINVVLILGVLLSGSAWRAGKIWLVCAAFVLMTAGSFFAMRWVVHHFAPPRVAFENTATMDENAVLTDEKVGEGSEAREPGLITGTGRGHTGYGTRILGLGTWFSFLLWQPLRLAGGLPHIWWFATAVGWIVVVFVVAAVAADVRDRRLLVPAMFLYILALDLNWPQANARYLVPIVPLILLSILRGAEVLKNTNFRELIRRLKQRRARVPEEGRGFPMDSAEHVEAQTSSSSSASIPTRALPPISRGQRALITAMALLGLGSVFACNLVLYGIDVWVMRSPHFPERYEAGMDQDVIALGEYLTMVGAGNWQVCINPEYRNMNRRRMSPTALRMLTMLTGKAILQLPPKYALLKTPRDQEFRRWIAKNQVRYYLEQDEISPWRVWHFRMGWLQRWETHQSAIRETGKWTLYICDGKSIPVPVQYGSMKKWPTRIPGM